MLIAAIKDDLEEKTKELWLDDALTPLERAKALYYSLQWQKDRITEWLLYHLDMPVATWAALLLANGIHDACFRRMLVHRTQCPSEELWRAAISKHLHYHGVRMFQCLHKAGGWALVMHALEAGCKFDPPSCSWYEDPATLSGLDEGLIARLRRLGFPALSELCLFQALHTRDPKLLKRTLGDTSRSFRHARAYVLQFALRAGWVEGTRLLADANHLRLPGSYLRLKSAMECPSPACLDVLLDLGSDWTAAAFWAAYLEANTGVLDHMVQRGGVGPLGTAIPFAKPHCETAPLFVESPSAWTAKMARSSTFGGFLPTCVVALVDAAKAGCLEAEICRWRENAPIALVWWGRQCGAYAQRQGTEASPNVPEVLACILGHAGIATAAEFRRAAPLAASICQWLGVHFPLQIQGAGKETRQGADGGAGDPTSSNAGATAPAQQGIGNAAPGLGLRLSELVAAGLIVSVTAILFYLLRDSAWWAQHWP